MESDHLWSTLLDGAVLHDDPMMSDTSKPLANTDHCYSTIDDQKPRHTSKRSHKMLENSVRLNEGDL